MFLGHSFTCDKITYIQTAVSDYKALNQRENNWNESVFFFFFLLVPSTLQPSNLSK